MSNWLRILYTEQVPLSLAQIGRYINPDVPSLPEPPLLERWLFEQPVILALGLAIMGLVLLVALRNAGRTRAGLLAFGAGILIAIGVTATGHFVQTERETLLTAQDALVNAVADADLEELEARLDPDARIRGLRVAGITPGQTREGILSLVSSTTGGPYRVRDFGIIKRQAIVDGRNTARTQTYVRVVPDALGSPTFAWFRILWRLEGEVWLAVEIEPLFISGVLDYQG